MQLVLIFYHYMKLFLDETLSKAPSPHSASFWFSQDCLPTWVHLFTYLIRISRILAIYWFQPRQGWSEDEQDTGVTPRSLKNDTVIPEARSMDAHLRMFPKKRIHSQVGSGNVGRAIKHVLSPKDFSEPLFWECALWISKKGYIVCHIWGFILPQALFLEKHLTCMIFWGMRFGKH